MRTEEDEVDVGPTALRDPVAQEQVAVVEASEGAGHAVLAPLAAPVPLPPRDRTRHEHEEARREQGCPTDGEADRHRDPKP